MRYQYILGVNVTERDEEYPELTDLPKTGEPSWVNALRVLDQQVLAERRDEFFISRGGYVPGRRALGKRRVALRREFFPGKPWLGLGTIDWCAGVRSTPLFLSRRKEADRVQYRARDAVPHRRYCSRSG